MTMRQTVAVTCSPRGAGSLCCALEMTKAPTVVGAFAEEFYKSGLAAGFVKNSSDIHFSHRFIPVSPEVRTVSSRLHKRGLAVPIPQKGVLSW